MSSKDNVILEEIPSMEKVRRVVFSMDRETAACPDGFTRKFLPLPGKWLVLMFIRRLFLLWS